MYRSLFFHKFHSFFLTTSHIIAISNKVSIEYIIISNIKEFASIGAVADKDTTSTLPIENIWDEGLRVKSCDELFIGGDGRSTSLSFFDTNS